MRTVLDTASVPDAEKLDYWNEAMGRALAPMAVTPRGERPFAGSITADQYGYLNIATVVADPARACRTPRLISRSPHADVVVGMQAEGAATLGQHGRTAELGPGDLVVFDTSRPFLYDHADRVRVRLFRLPKRVLHVAEADVAQLAAVRLGQEDGLTQVVASVLAALADEADPAATKVGERMAGHVTELLATLIEAKTTPVEQVADLTRRIRDYVNRHLTDQRLTPEKIAAAHHVSVRYLYKLFESEGLTIGRWIQQRRLEECRRELARRGRGAPNISAVAHRWGFVNAAHFSRTFRDAYGMSPSDWRNVHQEI